MQQLADVSARLGFRKAATNLSWLFVERAGRFVLGMLVGFLVARYLGPVRLGSLSYCTALVTLLGFLPALGLDPIVKRDLLRLPEKSSELLASSLAMRLAVGTFAYLVVLIAVQGGWGFTGEEGRLLVILGLVLFQPALIISDLWFQTQLRAKLAVTVQLAALAVSSALRVWLISARGSLVAFAWVIVLEMVLVTLGLFFAGRNTGLRYPITAAKLTTMKQLFAEAWPLMFASLAIIIYMKIDEVMLRQMAGPAEVGFYAAAARLSEMWYFVPMALASSVLPALVREREQNYSSYLMRMQQYYDLSAVAAYALSVPIALSASWLVRVTYGEAFAAAGPILAIHVWSSIFVFIGVARGQWLVNEGLQGFYLAATCAGAVTNVLLNFLFIPRWGGLGAAYATVTSYALASWMASYFHPAVRVTAAMQTRALLIPFLGWRYLRR